MINRFKNLLIPSGIFIILLTSCHRDPVENKNDNKIKSAVLYNDDGEVADSLAFTYTNDKVTRIDVTAPDSTYHCTYEYNGDKITKRNDYLSSPVIPESHMNLNYNSDGTLASMDTYFSNGSSETKDESQSLHYSNGHIDKLTLSRNDNGNMSVRVENSFIYTNNNITTIKTTNPLDPSTTFDLEVTYDNTENYLKKIPAAFFLDPVMLQVFEYLHVPIMISENNITSGPLFFMPVNFSYTLDNKNNLTLLKFNDQIGIKFNY
ncbi:MAG TPA: hypothetical protein VNS32_08495 [Flavisolibacter sp.]|nr:hypothetical protein [Flavisolibacter sp.]